MPFSTRYVFVVSMDVEPAKEALFNEVYETCTGDPLQSPAPLLAEGWTVRTPHLAVLTRLQDGVPATPSIA